jgi:hypothetical protein
MRVAEDIEAPRAHRVEDKLGHLKRTDLAGADRLLGHRLLDALAACRRLVARMRAVALAVRDARGDEVRAQHRRGDLVRHERQVLVQRLGQAHHGVFSDVVDAHVRRVEQPRHRCGVDDVALVSGIRARCVQHRRHERAQAVHDAHHVDAEHPVPIAQRGLPDQPAGADAGVVEHEMRCAEAPQRIGRQRVDLGGARHVDALRQHLRAQAGDLRGRALQRVALHVGHHDVHALARGDARGFEPETRARAGDHGRAALEALHHISSQWGKARSMIASTSQLPLSRPNTSLESQKREAQKASATALPACWLSSAA